MENSLSIGRLAGVRILLHWTFLLLLGFLAVAEGWRGHSLGAVLASGGFVLALFACVGLHELGHWLAARSFGIETRAITLLPIGGIATLERVPEKPWQEILVALAGPAVNGGIALLLYPFVAPVGGFEGVGLRPGGAEPVFLTALFWVNLLLVLLNALPALPLDGGRVLRALLAILVGRTKATAVAAGLGTLLAGGFVFYGLLGAPFMALIGIFVYFGARTQNASAQHRALLRDYTVGHAMKTSFPTLAATNSVQDAVNLLLTNAASNLLVLDPAGQAVGVITWPQLMAALRDQQLTTTVAEIMRRDFATVQTGDSLAQLYDRVLGQSEAFYPVLENHRLRGIITQQNLTEFLAMRAALSQ